MKSILLAFMAVLLAAAPALSQGKEPDAALETGESKAANVFRPEEDAETKAAIDPEREKIDKVVAAKEAELSKVRRRQIEDMRKILRDNPLYKKKADLLFRIAEKEWDEAKYRHSLKMQEWEKAMEAWNKGLVKERPEEPKPDYSAALTEYKALLKEFPNYSRIDEVMFYLGRGLHAADKKKEGASYMLRLTKEYPKSKFVTRAYLAVAEYYFDNDLLFAAKTNYQKVLEDKESQDYPYALYKLGYVHYNLKEFDDSIKSFHQVVDLSKGKDKRKIYFTSQAYGGLVLAYAEVDDGWKLARDYFRGLGGDELAGDQLERIARIYSKQDKTEDEVAVYEYLIGANKEGPKVPEYAEQITAAYKKQENMEKTDQVINRFFVYFEPKGSWYAVNKDKEEPMIRSKQFREEQLDWLISTYHKGAQDFEKASKADKADAYYRNAAKYYEVFIKAFPESKELYEKEFYLAEIFFYQMKDWNNSATWYGAAVARDPQGKYSKDSAYQIILAREAQMFDAGLVEKPEWIDGLGKTTKKKAKEADVAYTDRNKDDKEFQPIPEQPLAEAETRFLDACTKYLELYPKDDEVPAISFRAAEIFIKKGHYAEGVSRLEVIMEHHPKHRFAGFAAATLFDSNYRLRRWDQMERWARYMLERKNYKVLNKTQLEGVIAVSINNYANELREKGEKDKAVGEWLRFAKEFPKHEQAPAALFNAAAVTEQLEKTEQSIDLYESIIKRFPKSSQATEAHFVLGALYESQTEFEKAATYFEKMASFPDVPQMADSLYNAASIRGALEQHEKAIEIFGTFVKKFPDHEDTPTIYLQMAEFHEKEKDWKGAQKTYDEYAKKFAKSRPETLVELYLRKGKAFQDEGSKNARKLASAEFNRALQTYKKLPEEVKTGTDKKFKLVRRAAAEANFRLGEYVYSDFEAIQVRFPDSVLRKTLVQKAKLLEETNKIYFEVLDYKAHDVSAGALYRIGESFYLFAKSLFDLPVPDELTEDEKIIYRAELDDRAAPLQEKAIEALSRALKLAHENHVYNEWSRRSAALLVKLSPDAFPVLDDAVVNTEWEVPATFSTTFITDSKGKLVVPEEPKAAPKVEAPAAGAAAPANKMAADPDAMDAAAAAAAGEDAAKKTADEAAKKAAGDAGVKGDK
ncbi:MAG: tetratricopeptide repeat protein [Myxococcales bacterium]|nr:tetratricopeptide repeat protein [Myxococcales bacterium]